MQGFLDVTAASVLLFSINRTLLYDYEFIRIVNYCEIAVNYSEIRLIIVSKNTRYKMSLHCFAVKKPLEVNLHKRPCLRIEKVREVLSFL